MKHHFIADNDCGRLVNKQLTGKLIKLHAKGYDLDFYMNSNDHLICVQNGERFPCACLIVKLVDQEYDFITNTYKYLHTIDTACGKKGILLMENIYCLRISQTGIQIAPVKHELINHSFII